MRLGTMGTSAYCHRAVRPRCTASTHEPEPILSCLHAAGQPPDSLLRVPLRWVPGLFAWLELWRVPVS